MDETIKKAWVEALRSKKYKQGFLAMRTEHNEYCCLGVLCDILMPDKWDGFGASEGEYEGDVHYHMGCSGTPHQFILDKVNLTGEDISTLVSLNDIRSWDFDQISLYIEEKL